MRVVLVATAALAAVLSLAGCAGTSSGPPFSAWTPPAATEQPDTTPVPPDYQAQEDALILYRLKDPASAEIRHPGAPRPEQVRIHGGDHAPTAVQLDVVEVNAKNGFGGYVGFQPWQIAWKNGRIIAFQTLVIEGDIPVWQDAVTGRMPR